jgi:hypothetical protein
MNQRKLFNKLLLGSRNIRFSDLLRLVEAFGFVRGRWHRLMVDPCHRPWVCTVGAV